MKRVSKNVVSAVAFSLACAAVSAFGGASAFAEYQFPTSVTADTGTMHPGFASGGGPLTEIQVSGDGLSANTPSLVWANGDNVNLTFAIPDSWRNDLRIFIETPDVPGASTTAWQIITANFIDSSGDTSVYSGGAVYVFDGSTIVLSTFTPSGTFLQGGETLVGLQLQIVNTSGATQSGQLQLGLISNPEPGTMALFGLGALGLGGAAWRRRKARKIAAAKTQA